MNTTEKKQDLNKRNFALLWTGKFVSELGDKMYAIAMAWWILQTSGSPLLMGLYMTSAALPGILFGFFSGAVIDRVKLKSILVLMDIVRGAAITLLAFLYMMDRLTMGYVFGLTVVVSIASCFFNPAVTTIIPRLVKEDELPRANSFMEMIDGIATIAGPIFGVIIINGLGFAGTFLINGASYLLSAFSESFMKVKEERKESLNAVGISRLFRENQLLRDVMEGYTFIRTTRKMKTVLLFIAMAHFFVGAITVMMPYMAKFVSGDNINLLGILQVVLGSGFILGAVLTGRKKALANEMKMLTLFFFLIGLSITGIGLITASPIPVYATTACLFLVGFCTVNASIYWQTFIQSNTPPGILGRVSAISALVGDVTLPLSFALYGVLLDVLDFTVLTIASGTALLVIVLIVHRTERAFSRSSETYRAESV